MALPPGRQITTAGKAAANQGKRLDDDQLDRLAKLRAASGKTLPSTTQAESKTNVPLAEAIKNDVATRDPSRGTTPGRGQIPQRGKDDDDLDYLARLRAGQDRERQAAADERAASKAQQIQGVRAKAGAAGLGLSGASSGQEASTIRQADRANALDEAAQEKRYRDEEYDALGRQASLLDYEQAYGLDLDGDGYTAGKKNDGINNDGNPDNDLPDAPSGIDLEKQKLAEANEVLGEADYSWWDEPGQPGSVQEPYEYAGTKRGLEERIRESAPGALPLVKVTMSRGPGGGGDITIWRDQYGNHYTIVGDDTPSRREREVAR